MQKQLKRVDSSMSRRVSVKLGGLYIKHGSCKVWAGLITKINGNHFKGEP